MVRTAVSAGVDRRWWPLLAVALVSGLSFAVGLDRPAFFDNEGRYAEVAREMVLRRDLVTPYLDSTLFLNKPPLTYWLVAAVYGMTGFSEWARLVSVVAACATLVLAGRIGVLAFGKRAGLLGALMLATTVGFVLEARTLRPDGLVVLSVTAALWCWQVAERGRSRWMLGAYLAVGLGMLAKGLVPAVLAGVPILVCTLRDHGLGGLRRLRVGAGLLVVAAVVLPWHVAVALRHPGFAWDYVVNQHLLFFLDRKFPRDSEGDTLAFYWGAFLGRASPWVLLAPLAVGEGWRGLRRHAADPARATGMLLVWAAVPLVVFALTSARLEHYALPALPPTALLAARGWERLAEGARSRAAWALPGAAAVAMLLAGLTLAVAGPAMVERTYWIAQAPALAALARPCGVALAATGAALSWAVVTRGPRLLLGTLVAGVVPLLVIVVVALVRAEPLFSWKPVAELIRARTPPATEIVFESPEEYQLVGGLAFYAERPITLLEPPGFVPPTYLAAQLGEVFTPREEVEARWADDAPMVLVTDPQQRRESPAGLAPEPMHVLGRIGDRWILANPAAEAPGSSRVRPSLFIRTAMP